MKLFILFLLLAATHAANAQYKLAGNWEGKLEVATRTIRTVIHFKKEPKGGYSATLDDPDRKVYGVPCDTALSVGDSLSFSIASIRARYDGKFASDGETIGGYWTQGTYRLPLVLRRQRRPQTPVPPFSYAVEEVEYDNADKSAHFGATLTKPRGVGPFKAAILITGSGQQDRDCTLFGHKSFMVIADYLTKRGIAVLRVDDRGMGLSTGDVSHATTADFAKDVETSLDYLETRGDIDQKNIGLIGHSEGGLIASMVAGNRKEVAFVVSLAGAGVDILELMLTQNGDIMASMGLSPAEILDYKLLYKKLMDGTINEHDHDTAMRKGATIFKTWQHEVGDSVVWHTTRVVDSASMYGFLDGMTKAIAGPWFNYFLRLHPSDYWKRVACPVLALDGSRDIQVAPDANLGAIKKALIMGMAPSFEVKVLPGLNHLFQTCTKCTVGEYADLEETFSPDALLVIGDWINTIGH